MNLISDDTAFALCLPLLLCLKTPFIELVAANFGADLPHQRMY
jgi:hypothetical protein